jgi:hypothetical protein
MNACFPRPGSGCRETVVLDEIESEEALDDVGIPRLACGVDRPK